MEKTLKQLREMGNEASLNFLLQDGTEIVPGESIAEDIFENLTNDKRLADVLLVNGRSIREEKRSAMLVVVRTLVSHGYLDREQWEHLVKEIQAGIDQFHSEEDTVNTTSSES